MNSVEETGGVLEEAFKRFERTASMLDRRHQALRRQADALERELMVANRRLEAVLEALDSGVAVVSLEGTLVRTNRAFEALGLGRVGERIGEPALLSILDGDGARPGATRLKRLNENGERDLAVTVYPAHDESGARVIAIHDITEIRRQEEEGGRRQRLEALGHMAAELAHEVRNPLGSIRLFAAMLKDDLEERPTSREMADQILSAVSGLEGTVANLLAFATSSGSGPLRGVDLARTAAEVCSLLEPACSLRGIRLAGPNPPREALVHGDPEGLRQVLLNLVANALAACRSGDTIRVSAETSGQRVSLTVNDTGHGIPTDDLPRIFDPFFSRTAGGSGLGLSIVHGIVERHGGRIVVESRPECGTRVTVELPVGPPAVEGASDE